MYNKIHQILQQYWGHTSFRPIQQQIINSVLQKQDTIALLPTGGGKSLCFQIPALYFEGVCVVISPLIALMQDQVSSLIEKGIKENELVDANPEVMLFSMLSTLRSLYIWLPKKEDLDIQKFTNELSLVLINGINK